METQKLLQADYLDIVYDHRNKKYGGYELRKNYDQRMRRGVLFLLAVVAALCCFSFVKSDKPTELHKTPVIACPVLVNIATPKPEPKVLPERPVEPPKQVKTKLFTDPVITKDPFDPDKQMTENKYLANVIPGNTNTDGDSLNIIPTTTGHTGTGFTTEPPKPIEPVRYVAQMPQFAGDMEAYIGTHLHYPEPARINNIEGRVLIEFVVNEDGTVSDARVARSIGGGCDEEALRMVYSMPKWKPGKQNGTAVKVLFTLPIKFVLN